RELAGQLHAAGRTDSVIEFRARQAISWAATAGAILILVVGLRVAGAPVNVGGGVVSAALLGVAGPVAAQLRVRQAADRRRLAVELELPAVAGLLSLCL